MLDSLDDFEIQVSPAPGNSNAMISDPFFLSNRLNVLRNVYIFKNIMQIGKYRINLLLFVCLISDHWGTRWKHGNIISLIELKVSNWVPKLVKIKKMKS